MNRTILKPVVAHISDVFFVQPENGVYHYLSHLRDVKPICLATRLENVGSQEFFFPPSDIYSLRGEGSTGWITRHLTGRIRLIEKIVKERNARLLHAHFGHNGVQLLKLKKRLNLPMVTTFYGSDLSRSRADASTWKQYRRLFEEGDMFLVEGLHMQEKLHQLGCPREKIHLQRLAIPVEDIPFRERKPKGNRTVKLLFCGRFIEKKGLIYALQAVHKVKTASRYRDISFCIVGDGELRAEIESYIADHHMQEYVELPGFLSYGHYLKQVEEADIFIHPSVTASDGDSEGGAPTTILEAHAMGLPVISTLHADIPNVVVPDLSAMLSPERDVDSLKRNLSFLLENQHLWSRMGKTGRQFIEQNHDIKKEAVKLERKYQRLLS